MNDILIKIGGDITGLSQSLSRASSQIKNFTSMNKQTFDSFKKVGTVASGMGIALATGLGLAVKQSVDFESAFAGVRKTVDASEKEFGVLSDGIRKMATELPASANEIAGVAEMAGQLGIKKEDILGFTRTMIDLGESTNMSSEDAATALARLANITQMPMDKIGNLGSTVVALGNNLATTESEIVEMGLRLAGAGHQIGMSEDQILAFGGALSSVGIRAEAGGSAFSRVMINMAQATEMGGEELDGFAKVAGMSSSEFQKAFKDDAALAIVSFVEGLGKMNDEGKNTFGVLDELGLSEIRVRDALLRASGAGDLFRESLELGSTAWEENTALTEEAEERYKTTASKLKVLKNNVIESAMALGDVFLPAIGNVIDFLQGLIEKFNGLSDTTKAVIAVITAVTAGVLILGGGLLLLIGFIPAIVAGFGALATVLGAISWPIVAIIAGIAALAAGLIYAWETSETFREVVSAAFEAVQTVVMTVIDAVVAFVMDIWGQLVEFWIEHGQMILEASQNVWNTIWEVISVAMMGIWEVLKVAWDLIVEVVTIAWDLISGVISGSIDVILGIINTFAALFTGDWDELWVGIQEILSGAWDIIATIFTESLRLIFTIIDKGMDLIIEVVVTIFTTMWQFIQTIFGLVVDYIQFAWDNAVRIVSEKAAEILKWVIIKFTEVKTTVTEVLSAVASIIRDKFQEGLTNVITKATSMYTTVRDKFNEIKTAVTDKMTQVKDQISDKFQEGVNIVRTKLAEMWLTVTEKFASIYTAVLDKMGQVKQTIEDMWNKAVDFLKEIDLFQIGEDIINGLKDGIKSKAEDVGTAIKGVADTITGKITGALGIFSPSRVLKKIGVHTGEGLELGIASMAGRVGKAAQGLAEAAVVSPPKVDVGYSTPGGVRSSVSSAINGTMDVTSSRDSSILAKMDEQTAELRKQHQMIIELDGQRVGEAVTPHVNGKNAIDSTVRRYF